MRTIGPVEAGAMEIAAVYVLRPHVMVFPIGLVVLPLVVPVMPAGMLMMLRMPVTVVMPGVLVMVVMMLRMLALMVMPAVMALAIIIPVVVIVLVMLMVARMSMPFIGIPLAMAVIPFTGVTAVIALPVPVPAVIGHRAQRQREHRAPKYYGNHS